MPHVLAQDLRNAVLQAALNGHLSKHFESDKPVNGSDIDIGNTDEYEIIEHWIYVKLSSITNIKNGFTPKRSVPEYWDSKDIPWFTVDDIHSQGHEIKSTIQYISSAALGKSKSRIVKANTVLLCCTSATIGNYAITRIPLTTNQQWNGLEIKDEYNEDVIPEYLLIWASTLKTKLISEAGQTTFPFLSTKKLGEFVVPLPPIEEQARIVARVDELMAKIDEYEKIEKELTELQKAFPGNMKDAILQASMQGKLTEQLESDGDVYEYLDDIASLKASLIQEKKLKKDKTTDIVEDEYPFDIPDSWAWTKFGAIANLRPGKTPPRAEPTWWGDKNDVPWVSIADMIADGHVSKTKEFISQAGFKEKFKESISPAGTMIMSFKLTVGRVSYLDIDALHNEAIISIFPFKDNNNILQSYLFKVLPYLTKYGDSKNAIKGTTLNEDSLCNLYIPLPPFKEQQRIVDKLDQLLPLCEQLEKMAA